ncbi:hypothetical protein CJ468_06305 [Nocardia farcinica]|nr:hypothetical protein CJ468_06305 [Nocardia farcinica]
MSEPICSSPSSIRCPPNQITATVVTLLISMTTGNISAINLPTRSEASVRSVFARPNRQVSCRSRTKARTTLMPVICSRSTRFTTSMRACISRKPGTSLATTRPIANASAGTAMSSSQDSFKSSRSAMMMPPTHMIGAITSTVTDITTSSCTCCTSLVLRVISEGAPNRPTSRAEKVPTRCTSAARRSRPALIAAWAPRNTDEADATICTAVTASIHRPVCQM